LIALIFAWFSALGKGRAGAFGSPTMQIMDKLSFCEVEVMFVKYKYFVFQLPGLESNHFLINTE